MDLGSIKGSVELDIADFERKYGDVDRLLLQLEGRRVKDVQVGADTETATRQLTSLESLLKGAIDGARAEVDVLAETGKADAELTNFRGLLDRLDAEVASVRVDADTSPAEAAFDDLADEGEQAGDDAGMGMAAGILAGLASIPIAGAVIKVGQAIGEGLLDGVMAGLQQEATRDLFSARTGLDAATADRFGRAAGNAYGQAWGESIETNLDTARLALQGGLIDADDTTAEVEEIIASLSGVSELLGEDIPRLSRAVGVMMKTDMAPDAQAALDILVSGMQAGANVSEDLLDTYTEYPAVFERLGLDGQTSMGLISQAMQAGARDTDYAADALKEFQIRATDGSEASADAYKLIGLSAEDMTAKIAKGGADAEEGLGMVLDALRAIEDPVLRNQAAVGLFGTKAEDLGDALFAMDTSTAVSELEELGDVAGRSGEALDTMADNTASSVESAKRSIEVSAQGIQGALAVAFSDPLTELSAYVSSNRAGVLEFMGLIANGFFDAGRAVVEFAATGLHSMGDFINQGIIPMIEGVEQVVYALDGIPGVDLDAEAFTETTNGMVDDLRGVAWDAYAASDDMRTAFIDEGIDPIQDRFNEGLDTEIIKAQVHDATTAMQSSIGDLGESLEDVSQIELFEDGSFKTATEDAQLLDEQLRTAVDSIGAVQESAKAAGESQSELNARWQAGRDALVAQLEAMGFTTEQAQLLAEAYGAVPEQIETSATLDTAPAKTNLGDLVVEIDAATGTVTVNGDKTPADTTLGELVGNVNASDGTVKILGNKVPADITLEQLLGAIGSSSDTVTINGQDYPARSELGQLLQAVRASSADIRVGANTYSATSALDNMIRTYNGRTMTVYTMMKTIGQAPVATGGYADDVATAYGLAGGGTPQSFTGRMVTGPGTPTSDEVDARLSREEFVQRAAAVDYYGVDKMYELNAMTIPREWLDGVMAQPLAAGGRPGAAAPSMVSSPAGGHQDLSGLAAQVAALSAAVASIPDRIEAVVEVDRQAIARGARAGLQEIGAPATWGDPSRQIGGRR